MARYIINHSLDGYETVNILDTKLTDTDDNTIILVLDETTSDKLQDYYERVIDILLSKNRLYVIVVGKESKIRKAICTLVTNYRNYNLYKVDSKTTITKDYIDTIIERLPTIDEVQSFMGGDISGYSDINVILLGIDDLVSRGDLEGLKRFIEEHLISIEGLTSAVDYMKKIVDTTNSKELLSRIEELKTKLREADRKLDNTEEENRKIKDENLKLSESSDITKKELARIMSKNKELEQQMSSNAPVIQSYSEINTTLIKCKTANVIYFKEISYVPYTNSLIIMLMEVLKLMKKKAKLIIYDSKVGLSTIYKPLSVIGGSEFVTNKANFIAHAEAFVVVEPNPTILTSILENTNPAFDVVIVYDRMRQSTDIVSGNNVVKFYVINSNKDFREVQNQLRITEKSSIITRVGSSIGSDTLNIPAIDDYNAVGTTNSAKISKYKKLQASGNNKLIIQTILDKARVSGR